MAGAVGGCVGINADCARRQTSIATARAGGGDRPHCLGSAARRNVLIRRSQRTVGLRDDEIELALVVVVVESDQLCGFEPKRIALAFVMPAVVSMRS